MYSYSSSRNSYNTEIRPKDKDQPLDTISSIIWDKYKNQPSFITSSWDGYLRYYMLNRNNNSNELQLVWKMFMQHPVLCCDINQNNIVFGGLASGDVVAVSLQNNNIVHMGCHEAPICGIFWIAEKGCLITLGFDNLIKFWSLETGNNFCQLQQKLPLKTYTCAFDYPYLLIGSNQASLHIVNFSNLPNNVKFPQYSNDYQKSTIDKFSRFNCSCILARNRRAAMGTIDGRTLHYTFKQQYGGIKISDQVISRSQKKGETRSALFGQVNTVDLGCHNSQTFGVIGGSQDIGVFNLVKKSRTKTIGGGTTSSGSVTASRISPKNDYLAYSTGCDWLRGLGQLQNIKKPKIFLFRFETRDLNQFVIQ